jgi:hypothetical protein
LESLSEAPEQNKALKNLESIARALAAGYTFGPRSRCASCHKTSADPDEVNRGVCDRCIAAIEALTMPDTK